MKGDHLVGKYYVIFDQKYKAEIQTLMENGASEDEAKRTAPLILEAQKMLLAWENGDAETRQLWETMNGWVYEGFDKTYKKLGVDFDKIYYESETYLDGKQTVETGLEKGVFYRRDDSSIWADLTGDGLDEKLLLRSDGTSVYMTQDIGTAKIRYDDYPINKMVYVVGNEQNYHFQVLAILLDKLGFAWGKSLVHFSYGMVELPEGKMKSREGTVVDADDLIEEMIRTARETAIELGKVDNENPDEIDKVARIVGLGALKYFMLKVDPRKNMVFNPKESIDFNGNTGPFIQYTHARIKSVLRKANEQSIDFETDIDEKLEISDKESNLIQLLADFEGVVRQAGVEFSPALIANYIYELVKEYNQFYHEFSILREENDELKRFRLVLSASIAQVIKTGMSLLGIEVPERM
jgi:arginyl-tRNA synthetase